MFVGWRLGHDSTCATSWNASPLRRDCRGTPASVGAPVAAARQIRPGVDAAGSTRRSQTMHGRPYGWLVRLQPLYTIRFRYPEEGRSGTIKGDEAELFFPAEGTVEGGISGRFIGANHPRRRSDGTYRMDLQGAIETDDGAQIVIDYQGYGRTSPVLARQVVGAAWHFSSHEKYRRLNDVVCAINGEVRRPSPGAPQGEVWLVLDLLEQVWEPLELNSLQ